MDMDSPDKAVEGITEEDGPSLMENPDLDISRHKHEQQGKSYDHKSEASSDGIQVYSDQHTSSPVVLVGSENEGLQSPITKSITADLSSPGTKYEEYGDVERRISYYATEEQRFSAEDYQSYNNKERVEDDHIAHPGNILNNNDNENFNNDFQSEDSYSLPHNSLLTGDNNNHYETMGDAFTHQTAKSPRGDESGNGVTENTSADFHCEKAKVYAEKEGGNMSPLTDMKQDEYSSVIEASGNGGMVWENSSLHSPQRTQNASPSPERHFSISAERSPHTQSSPRTNRSPRQEGFPYSENIDKKSASSPISHKRERSPSPEKHSGADKRPSSRDRSSPTRHKSPSERSSQRDYHHRDGSPRKHIAQSPRRRDSPRRRGRSTSRSPVRRRESPGRRRDQIRRSRSRSPHARDRYRRSPRRRPSPRRRSPPPSYSRRRSPRRPWSPPSNRNTGLGKPGNNLFVAGFSYATTERDLEKKFSRFGRVTDVRIVRERRSGESRGFGFLSLERDEDADAAIRAVDQTEWNGRIVLVEKSKTPTR